MRDLANRLRSHCDDLRRAAKNCGKGASPRVAQLIEEIEVFADDVEASLVTIPVSTHYNSQSSSGHLVH